MKKRYQYILFDLDGTLTDPKEGITKSVQYALASFGINEPNLDQLEKFIGPPLRVSFPDFYGFDEEETKKAIKKFRERYHKTGVFENEIYAGMRDLLAECKQNGIKLAIASSKPQYLVEKVLENFQITQYFDVIVGCLDEGVRDTKNEVMEEALRQLFPGTDGEGKDNRDMTKEEFPRDQVLMVGDRIFDIEGAKHFGVDSLGVRYGYAPKGELEKAKATYLCDTIAQMRHIMLGRWVSRENKETPSFRKSFEVLLPLAYYWGITMSITFLAGIVIGMIFSDTGIGGNGTWLKEHSGQISVFISALAALCTYPLSYHFYKTSVVFEISPVIKRRNHKIMLSYGPFIFLWAGIVAVGLNIAMTYLGDILQSATYEKVSNTQYSVSMITGVIVFGIITPVAEELVFRGAIYNRLKRYFSPLIAIIVSSFIFGIYHGNMVQLIYATIMGVCMALIYEVCGKLSAPVLFHAGANTIVYIASKNEDISAMLNNKWIMMICLIVAIQGFFRMVRESKQSLLP